jgi:lipopolysaccharide/colanic/teichoic acid biosynthesis glycosyltransferase
MLGKIIGGYLKKNSAAYVQAAKEYVETHKFPSGDFSWSPLSKMRNQALKRAIDIAVGLASTAALVPITLVAAPLIKAYIPGSLLVKDTRVGKNGAPLVIYKFRTTIDDPDAATRKPVTLESAAKLKLEGDPLVPRMGKILRSHAVDETLQFWHILIGDMSLIGPRLYGESLFPTETTVPPTWREHRLRVPPALAGVDSIYLGRFPYNAEEVIPLEIYYLGNWSLTHELSLMAHAFLIAVAGVHE